MIIIDEAARRGVDLIVMATHGYSGLKRWALGSVVAVWVAMVVVFMGGRAVVLWSRWAIGNFAMRSSGKS